MSAMNPVKPRAVATLRGLFLFSFMADAAVNPLSQDMETITARSPACVYV